MRATKFFGLLFVTVGFIAAFGCAGDPGSPYAGGTGAPTGGTVTGSGKSSVSSSSTTPASGGSSSNNSSAKSTTGGAADEGGAANQGGSKAATEKGGADGVGGAGKGGSSAKVSDTGKGGSSGSGGSGKGGSSAKAGGATGKGGASTSTGGKAADGGAATSITNSCSEANKTVSSNGTGQHCGYTYEYWKDSGTGSLILKPDGFSVSWSGINNLLGRKGIRPGSKNLSVTYEANYQPNGNSYLCVYGWTKGPLIEYYIVDSWGSWKPPGGTSVGTVSCDGGTYDIYKTQRVNQPSIEGNTTFYQFWSVRTAKRTSGTITVACHFDAWAAKGLSLGSFYEVSMTVEGYQSSGTADVKMSIK